MIYLQYEPIPDNIEQNMIDTREEIKRCLTFAISKAKSGATFLFGEQVNMNSLQNYIHKPNHP